MTKTFRMTRSVSAVAAAGFLVFGAVGCGAMKTSKDEETSASSSSEATSSESPSSSDNSNPADEPSDSGSETPDSVDGPTTPSTDETTPSTPAKPGEDPTGTGAPKGGTPAVKGDPVEVDPTPLTEAEKEKGKQMMADFFVAISTSGDFSSLCDIAVFKDPSGTPYRMDKKPEMREKCAGLVGQIAGAGGAGQGGSGLSEEQAKSLFDPATFELKDNGDGSFALSMKGQSLGFSILKIKDGGVRVVADQVDLSGQPN